MFLIHFFIQISYFFFTPTALGTLEEILEGFLHEGRLNWLARRTRGDLKGLRKLFSLYFIILVPHFPSNITSSKLRIRNKFRILETYLNWLLSSMKALSSICKKCHEHVLILSGSGFQTKRPVQSYIQRMSNSQYD